MRCDFDLLRLVFVSVVVSESPLGAAVGRVVVFFFFFFFLSTEFVEGDAIDAFFVDFVILR